MHRPRTDRAQTAHKPRQQTIDRTHRETTDKKNSNWTFDEHKNICANRQATQNLPRFGHLSGKSRRSALLAREHLRSNLLADISEVDYTKGQRGRAMLQQVEGLPPFAEDIYIFGYELRDNCVFARGRFSARQERVAVLQSCDHLSHNPERKRSKPHPRHDRRDLGSQRLPNPKCLAGAAHRPSQASLKSASRSEGSESTAWTTFRTSGNAKPRSTCRPPVQQTWIL